MKKRVLCVLALCLCALVSCQQIEITEVQTETGSLAIFQIDFDFMLLENNHVGEEWGTTVFWKEKPLESGTEITAREGELLTLTVVVTERDNVPDVGEETMQVRLADGAEVSMQVTVTENCGRHCVEKAVWAVALRISFLGPVRLPPV